jgi:arsenate reductase (thioredoxin)
MINILVLCTGNSCRSQIAHAYLEHYSVGKSVRVYSAGIETHGVNPLAVATLAADDIDITHHTSNNVDEYSGLNFDHVITVCDHAKEVCPVVFTAAKMHHHSFIDPAKAVGSYHEVAEIFAQVRNEIKRYCKHFVDTYC